MIKNFFHSMVKNEMEMNNKIHCKYLNLWNVITNIINEHIEIEMFMEYHQNVDIDTLDSLIESLGFETRNNNANVDTEMEINNDNKSENILYKTRCNGIEWFSPLIFSEKGKSAWNVSTYEWNLIIFEQILCELFMINDNKLLKDNDIKQISINCIRESFEISKK
eukprot:121_1